jgi:hypothetical protein
VHQTRGKLPLLLPHVRKRLWAPPKTLDQVFTGRLVDAQNQSMRLSECLLRLLLLLMTGGEKQAVRPNYCVFATEGGRLVIHGLYYNGRKAKRAYRKLRSKDPDGSYTMLRETGSYETIFRTSSELCVYVRLLGDHIWTQRDRWKKSFFDTLKRNTGS